MLTNDPNMQLRQELLNSKLHGLGILFGLISMPLLLALAIKQDSTVKIVGASVYGISFLMVFTFSTLYHGYQEKRIKRIFKILDHISIYFLIAGTYTPLVLIYQNNKFGIGLLVVLWSLTFVGSILKIFFCGRWEILSTIIYMMMGWSMLAGGDAFFKPMPADVLNMVIIGGVLYSIGVIFYIWERYFYSHAVWHSFVLVAAICHYRAILLSI